MFRNRNFKGMAKSADRFDLYQKSVQSVERDARFLAYRSYQERGRPARVLREDFCGTARLLCEFVRLHRKNRGIGIDLDSTPLDWSRANNLPLLRASQQKRIRLIRQDVINITKPPVDLVVAFNYSYSVFKERRELLRYFRAVYRSLSPGGLFMIDCTGGKEVPEPGTEIWNVDDFQYAWEVSRFDPITHHYLCKIHFLFSDGSKIKNAFVYDWRLWSIPELRELMASAGFRKTQTFWECTDRKTNLGNGVMRRVRTGSYEDAFYAVLIAHK
jgi:SAM-dependent methyltransferase